MKTYYISFDDTDNLNSLGTGHLLQNFLDGLNCKSSFISRHQLFFNPAVPYTSHNSSMVSQIITDLSETQLAEIAGEYLEQHLALGADPGLCIARLDSIINPQLLVNWGYRAKKEVLCKEDAYALAQKCNVHLSEHGGTGQGVVGALAAIGLRLAGQDGRVKGKKTVSSTEMTVEQLLNETGFQCVSALGEGILPKNQLLFLKNNTVKAVYQNFKSTVIAEKINGKYYVLDKSEIKCF